MPSLVSVDLLKPHPKNGDYFEDPTPEEYEQIKRSVAEHGIRDPLKVLPDYTVVAGCLRLRVAKELGLTYVPVEIWDVSGEEAEYLLVADNEERRTNRDPVKKAKRAELLRRYWGVRKGSLAKPGTPEGHFVPQVKTLADVAEAVGETERTVKRLLKLNDLIPPLQRLVSAGLVPQTVGYYLAFATPEEQEELLAALGEAGLGGLSAEEARRLKRELEAQRARAQEVEDRMCYLEARLAEAEEGSREAEKLAAELERLRAENERLKARPPEVIERIVEKAVRDPEADRQIATLQKQVAFLTEELNRLSSPVRDREKLEEELQRKRAELEMLNRSLSGKQCSLALSKMAEKLFGPLEREQSLFFEHLREAEFSPLTRLQLSRGVDLLRTYASRIEDALRTSSTEEAAYAVAGAGEGDGPDE